MKKPIPLLVLFLAALSTSCAYRSVDWEGLDNAEAKFNERQRQEIVAYMSLETMFPEPSVRSLAKAAGKGDIREIEELVANGVNVNSRGKKNAPPLFWAMRSIEGYKKLLELGANPNAVFEGGSIMHWAAKHQDIRYLKSALEHGGNPNLVAGDANETPIFKTITGGAIDRSEARKLLLKAGANINAESNRSAFGISVSGITPLIKAATLARFDIAYELLSLGADYSAKSSYGEGVEEIAKEKAGRFIPGSKQELWVKKVLEWLAEKGGEKSLTSNSSQPQAGRDLGSASAPEYRR
jgi:ankyrin repeat protein